MSFFKSLLLAILATMFLTYALGMSFLEFFDLSVMVDDEQLAPLQAISMSALVVVVLILVALAIVLSVFGGAIFIAVMVLGSIAMAIIGIFWPVLLVALAIYLLAREKKPTTQEYYS
ncbi:hypothetical protein LP316_00990 [Thalassotalea sp. LPB0316]|uniref:hypothetical protein n=1 Tax=Thalassotalea sp. LPB0316 TaxID=2769490 RepID=UPI001868692B|nr:hypothetical protein [Thalassotalea sp. LPB0316]QOL25924.1 hypothetical protein LP316_00990 [Thalassotalea sp. LPB0316]